MQKRKISFFFAACKTTIQTNSNDRYHFFIAILLAKNETFAAVNSSLHFVAANNNDMKILGISTF
jgi:hypothetical protein